MAIRDIQYLINIRSNVQGAEVFIGNQDRGIIPANIPISTLELQRDFGGVAEIKIQKENYVSPITYELVLTPNPDFTGVVSDIQTRNDSNLSADVVDVESITFTNIPEFIIQVNKIENGNSVPFQQVNTQLFFDLEFTLNSSRTQPVEELFDTAEVKISINGKFEGVKFILNDEDEIGIFKDTDVYTFDIGDTIKLVSTDLERFRLTQITVRGNEVRSIDTVETSLESLTKTISLTQSLIITVDVNEIFVPTLELPSISLISTNQDRIYNLNTQSPYPIGIRKNNSVDSVRVVIGNEIIQYTDLGNSNTAVIIIPETKFDRIGVYNIKIIPRNADGDGERIYVSINVVDDIWVGEPDIKNISYPSVIQGADYVGTNVDFEISWESVNTDWVRISRPESNLFIKASSTGKTTLNIQNLLGLDGLPFSQNENEIDITLTLTPYNESGKEVLVGKEEILQIRFSKGLLTIPRSVAINRIMDGFISQFDTDLLGFDASKYLTHTLHLGGGDNKIITTWTGSLIASPNGVDRTDSLILKLYEPLPTAVQPNDQVWVSKYQSNPIIETVTVSGLDGDFCSPLKGPNFALEPDNGIGFAVYDELIASGSETSTALVNRYLGTLGVDTSKLNIQYTNETDYLFENFVNFSSAEERVNNFFYKVKLIDAYKTKIEVLTLSPAEELLLTSDFEILVSDGIDIVPFDILMSNTIGISEQIEAGKIFKSLSDLLRSLDGFEKFLYTSLTPEILVYPKTTIVISNNKIINLLKEFDDSEVTAWYNRLITDAREFDKSNPNYINNNIPEFISTDFNNRDFLLFFDMIGHHFDNIWVHINTLTTMRRVDEAGITGVPKEYIAEILKSLGWNPKRAFDSQFLWEYAFGQNKDGSQKYSTSLEDANNQIWRRILNNLPYLLKHKGTGRALKAVMATYGIPQSMLNIMEFGGPQDPTKGGASEYTFDDRTASLRLQSGASVIIPWKDIPATGVKPQSIEFMIKPNDTATTDVIQLNGITLSIQQIDNTFSELELDINGIVVTTPAIALSNQRYSNVVINKIDVDITDAEYIIYVKTSNGETITQQVSSSIVAPKSGWENATVLSIGNDFNGGLDEVRLWGVPLQEGKIDIHTLFPDSIVGNSITASTADLLFRLDFERPNDVVLNPFIKNVAINRTYSEDFATASNFYVADTYPFHYEPYERTVTATVPSIGFNYSNKIRFEEQELIGDLSYKIRATKKSFNRGTSNSNRLGIFVSPIKELNMDIIKAFGDFNIDNYIGDPNDQYNDRYSNLDSLREYYFQRLNLNASEYIQLVRYINKSLFDVIVDLTPARANVSVGLLIEPHFLERNKVRWNKPDGSTLPINGIIDISEIEKIEANYYSLVGIIDEDGITTLNGNIPTFDGIVGIVDVTELSADTPVFDGILEYSSNELIKGNIPTFGASITYELRYELLSEADTLGKFDSIGFNLNSMDTVGYGLYSTGENDSITLKRYDINGNFIQSKQSVFLIETEVFKNIKTQVSGYPLPDSQPGDIVEFEQIPTAFKEYTVTLLPYPSTIIPSGNITNITPLVGYFPTHYKFVNNLGEGLQRSFYKGSIQTSKTTVDGLPPVETFTTNPNILRVARTGRGSGEPILSTET
jgi:hypothetical protein